MGKFRIGDRVRFVVDGNGPDQKAGMFATVVRLDDDGDAIVDTDAFDDVIGWADFAVQVVQSDDTSSDSSTLLDQFAMAALTGLLMGGEPVSDTTAREAYTAARCMMKAREVQK